MEGCALFIRGVCEAGFFVLFFFLFSYNFDLFLHEKYKAADSYNFRVFLHENLKTTWKKLPASGEDSDGEKMRKKMRLANLQIM